ncbi:N-acetylglucosaminyldiphosphoundecaprenol N-acetyl-beta-D-mannosaminyltransferase [Pseudomonas arsenicoxydans]|uniref:N-acetylglucosaminyldiphosphoundecaprenol N-acetyl-beta-D-mannosaminyltransferase n=1 Tax=Pseudomonas arsenicoxydans TaxID=702115 RepID=A0A1H0Q9F0_9PSED|nr:WecB/TagA/CpsF family glycosyltransferase [Pseudomonas arsenicoxydans]SDP13944.1 N-acetylglucosaminyldiphosphoundecaprenol N-acetyl-beta-D-mannosaminyltransferase [Pseudomonas arsenicoxydans]
MIRLQIVRHYSPKLLDANQAYSFINFASIGSFFEQPPSTVAFFCDGMLMSTFISSVTGTTVGRVSFDFTSIADHVLGSAEQQGKRVYFVGARQAELDLFIDKIKTLYPGLAIAGYHHGYFNADQAEGIRADICRSQANILIVGLGAGLQEQFEQETLRAGFRGVAFTCGGFIRQEAMTTRNYYPAVINRLHLRAFYRMYREPHTIKRYLIDYPGNFLQLLAMIVQRKVAISVGE